MRVKRATAVAFSMLTALAASAEVYKCPDAGGKHKFQDTPCTGGARQNVKPVTIDSTPGYQTQSTPYSKQSSSDPMVGMGKNSLLQALGQPSRTTTTTNAAGDHIESLMFLQNGKAIVTYLKNGFVFSTTSVERDSFGEQRNCPSAIDIKNAETSANSITLTDREKLNRRYDIARMKACLP